MKLDILVIVAHPDDAELGCGGTIIKHVELGHKVGIIDLTRGELGTRGTPEIRATEAEAAAKIMGVSVRHNLQFADGRFANDETHRLQVMRMIRKYRPELVITNAPEDRHPDHGRASQLVKEACFLAGLKNLPTFEEGELQEPHRPARCYHIIQYKQLVPTLIVNIEGYLDKKMEAVLAYKSQFYDAESAEPETLISQPEFMEMTRNRVLSQGNYGHIPMGEAFITDFVPAVNDIMQTLPLKKTEKR